MTIARLMIAVFAAAVWLALWKLDDPCTPMAPIVALLYLCGLIGIYAARWQGRRWQTGLWLGLLLGPIGVIFAASNRVPDKPDRMRRPRLGGQESRSSERSAQ